MRTAFPSLDALRLYLGELDSRAKCLERRLLRVKYLSPSWREELSQNI